MENNSHDNVNVRLNTRINFYGPVLALGSIPVLAVGLFLFILWTSTHWSAAIALSAWLVYGFFSLVALTLLILIAALAVKIVIHPLAGAYERHIEARGQAKRNRVVYAQENAMVVEVVEGTLQVVPLFPRVLPAPKEEELIADDQTVIDFYKGGATYETIMQQCNLKYNKVQRIISDAKKRGEIPA